MGTGLLVHRKQGIEASNKTNPSELQTKLNMEYGRIQPTHNTVHSNFAPFTDISSM